MDTSLYGILSLSSLLGILALKSQGQKIHDHMLSLKEKPVWSPATLINEMESKEGIGRSYLRKVKQGSNLYKGKIFLEGQLSSKMNIKSVLEDKELLFSTFFTDDIYSNDKFLKHHYIDLASQIPKKIKRVKSSAPFYQLTDLENPEIKCKVSKNLDVLQSIGDKIFILFGMMIEVLNALSHTNLKFRGIKIGFSEIELGLKPGSIVTIFGEVIYNAITKEMSIASPQYIVKDKIYIIKRLRQKLFQKQVIYGLLYFPFLFGLMMIIRKLKIYLVKQYKRRQDQYLDKMRDFQKLFITDDMRCTVCIENVRNIILKPCKHLCICYKCYDHLVKNECPICKAPIQDYVEIFVS